MNGHKLKILTIVSYLTLGLALGGIIMVFCWLWYPYKTITVTQPYKMAKTELRQGEVTSYSFSYCKYTSITPTVEKFFVDGLVFKADYASAQTRVGCRDAKVLLKIPDTLPPGTYKLRITTTYQMNPIRKISADRYTEYFKVLSNNKQRS